MERNSLVGSWRGLSYDVQALLLDSAGNLYVGGYFLTAGAVTVNHIAVYALPAAATVTFDPAPTPTYPGGAFAGSVTSNSDVALSYSQYSGPCTQVGSIAVFTPTGVDVCEVQASTDATDAFFAGSSTQNVEIKIIPAAGWNALTTGLNFTFGNITVNAIVKIGSDLYVGGKFISPGDCIFGCTGIAKWDGTAWSALGTGVDGQVYS